MAKFKGVDTEGEAFTFEAESVEAALQNQNLGATSGVQEITSDALSQSQPFEPVSPDVATESSHLEGVLEAQTKASQLAGEQSGVTQEGQDDLFDDIVEQTLGTKGQAQLTAEFGEEEGVPELQEQLDDINQQIIEEQAGLQNQVDSISSEAGLTKAQASAQIAEVKTKSLSKQADLAIIKMSVVGDLGRAQQLVQSKVAIAFEQQQNKLNALELQFNKNQGLFDKSESQIYQAILQDQQNAINEEKELKTQISELGVDALFNGASQAEYLSIVNAESVEEAAVLAAPYLQEGGSDSNNDDFVIKLSPEKKTKLAGAGLSSEEITDVEAGVNDFGIEATLKAIDDTSKREAVAEAYDSFDILDQIESELAGDDTEDFGGLSWWERFKSLF